MASPDMLERRLAAALEPLPIPPAEMRELRAALERRPEPAVRLRPGIGPESLPFPVEPVPWHPRAYFCKAGIRPGAYLQYAAGDYYVQDAGSLLAVACLAVQPGELACDLCAAPGGKATAILEDLGERGWLFANEAIRGRLGALDYLLARTGSPRYLFASRDPAKLVPLLEGTFDAVLADVPCSGQALVARGRQAAGALGPGRIRHSRARERRILEAAARLVRPGGRLVYSTCTFAYLENESVVEEFLAGHPEWRPERVGGLEKWETPWLEGAYRLWPHRDRSGGAFAARLRRGGARWAGEPARERFRPSRNRAPMDPCPLPADVCEWGRLEAAFSSRTRSRLAAWPEAPPALLLALALGGPWVAERKGASWVPAHALALRRSGDWEPRRRVELDDAAALKFLRGEAVPLREADSAPRGRGTDAGFEVGWAVAAWSGRPLGWGRLSEGVVKPVLPKAARGAFQVEQ